MTVDKFYQLARALHRQKLDIGALLHTAVQGASDIFQAPHGCIVLVNAKGQVTDTRAVGSELDVRVEREFWNRIIDAGVMREAINRWRPVITPNIAGDPTWPQLEKFPSLRWRGTAAALPLIQNDTLIGVLALIHPQVDAFGEREKVALLELAELVGEAIDNALTFDAVQRGYARLMNQQESDDDTSKLRHDLTAMIYHDLRAPLHNIHTSLGTLELLMHANDPAMAEKLLRIAMQSSRRLIRMVKSLLDIDRLEAGRAVLHRKTTTFASLFSDLVASVKPLADENDQTLTTVLTDDVPEIVVDHDMILRVIINLVENAIKHTPPGGRITVSASERNGEMMIGVRDTGPGIPAAYRQEVFDKYFRIRHTDSTTLEEMKIGVPNADTPDVSTRGGVGLGLAFCRLAVEAHGGRIWVEDAPGGGAVFAFSLPLEQEAALAPMMAFD
ncbi:MAG: ATP-binding protein [Chloroflexota bacterium]|nr:ATP-binding protein [Chloroflexota bacterium]